jgi:hypothetical protein
VTRLPGTIFVFLWNYKYIPQTKIIVILSSILKHQPQFETNLYLEAIHEIVMEVRYGGMTIYEHVLRANQSSTQNYILLLDYKLDFPVRYIRARGTSRKVTDSIPDEVTGVFS